MLNAGVLHSGFLMPAQSRWDIGHHNAKSSRVDLANIGSGVSLPDEMAMLETRNEVQQLSSSYPFPWVLITLLSIIATFLVRYPNRYIFTLNRPDIPGPRGQPILGNTLEVARNIGQILLWMDKNLEKYGPLWSFTMPGWGRSIMVNHPVWLDHIRKRTFMVSFINSHTNYTLIHSWYSNVYKGIVCSTDLSRIPRPE